MNRFSQLKPVKTMKKTIILFSLLLTCIVGYGQGKPWINAGTLLFLDTNYFKPNYILTKHQADLLYALIGSGSNWPGFGTDHTHAAYGDHNHSGVYEPSISKSTGYLKWSGSAWSFLDETYSLSSHNHYGIYEPVLGNPANNGYVLSSTTAGVRSWIAPPFNLWLLNGDSLYNYLNGNGGDVVISSAYDNNAYSEFSRIRLSNANSNALVQLRDGSDNNFYYLFGNTGFSAFKQYIYPVGPIYMPHPLNLGLSDSPWDTGYLNHLNLASLETDGSPSISLTLSGNNVKKATFPSSMVYPGAGVPISTGSAWGSSITGTNGKSLRFISGSWRAWNDSVPPYPLPTPDSAGKIPYSTGSAYALSFANYFKYTQSTKRLDLGCLSFYGGTGTIKNSCGGNLIFDCDDGLVQFNYLGTSKWTISNTGLIPSTNNVSDVGSSDHNVRDIYMAGVVKSGSWNGSSINTTYTDAKCTATWPNSYSSNQNTNTSNAVIFYSVTMGFDAGMSNNTAKGTIINGIQMAQNSVVGDVFYIAGNGQATLCKADAIANCPYVFAMCADATISQNATGNICTKGFVRHSAWNWTTGGLIYVSTTGTSGNTLTQTAPSGTNNVIVPIGIAINADQIYFFGNLNTVEHN
jgi:hypothetical protein